MYLNIWSTKVYVPSSELGLPQASVPSPPDKRVGGGHTPRGYKGKGVGGVTGVPIPTTGEKA